MKINKPMLGIFNMDEEIFMAVSGLFNEKLAQVIINYRGGEKALEKRKQENHAELLKELGEEAKKRTIKFIKSYLEK